MPVVSPQAPHVPHRFAFAHASVVVLVLACSVRSQSQPAPATDAGLPDAGPSFPAGPLVLSEIMYHPVGPDGPDDPHEFIELANRGTSPVALDGWSLGGDVKLTLPEGASIDPGEYLVVAKRRAALLAVTKYGLRPDQILGEFEGSLDNGKRGTVTLLDRAGQIVDAVSYSAQAPWPIGADALGVGPEWWPEAWGAEAAHYGLGRSLERVSLTAPSDAIDNWEASPLDGATPARPNASAGTPRPIVLEQDVRPAGRTDLPARPGERLLVRVRFSGSVTSPLVEHFVDDPYATGESTTLTPLVATGDGFTAMLPGTPPNAHAIVRYRILARREGPEEVLSPRPSDPLAWHGTFVEAPLPGKSPAYHIYVTAANWGKMWTNCEPGFVAGCGLGENPACTSCEVNPLWNATVPAVFASRGVVWDARVRYQGGKFLRLSGRKLASVPEPAPDAGMQPPPALGWKVKFPRYARFEGRKAIRLNKRTAACSGVADVVVSKLFEAAGVPSFQMRYARVYVNGGYYLYALEQEPIDDVMIERLFPKQPVGELYDANSLRWDVGPYGWGDFRLLDPFCGYTEEQRYAYTYERQTNTWKDNADLVALIRGLHEARAAGNDELRTYLEKNFDRNLVLRYLAIMNFANAWDDDYHNYALYRRPDGKWIMFSTDHNGLMFGSVFLAGATSNMRGRTDSSFYIGSEGDPSNWRGRFNYLKDSFFRVWKDEFDETLRRLGRTVLATASVDKTVNEAAADFSVMDAAPALSFGQRSSGYSCDDPTGDANAIRTFAAGRLQVLRERLGE